MYLLPSIFVLPSLFFIWKTIKYWISLNQKQLKYSHAKVSLGWLVLIIIVAIALNYYEFNALKSNYEGSFWVYSITYYIGIDLLCFFAFYSIKISNSLRNILKLIYFILLLVIIIPVIKWNFQIANAGIYDGKIGTSQYLASKIISEKIGSNINHQILNVANANDDWKVTVILYTRDSKTEVEKKYLVNKKTRHARSESEEKVVTIKLIKSSAMINDIELLLAKQGHNATDTASNWRIFDYAVSDVEGKSVLRIKSDNNQNLKLQIHDCAIKCTDYYYILKNPVKESYEINLDVLQSGYLEL